MKKVFKPTTQQDELLKVIFDAYPNYISTHQIRQETYIVDVPKVRNLVMENKKIVIKSKVMGYRQNKFGRTIPVRGYKLCDTSLKDAEMRINSLMVDIEQHSAVKSLKQRLKPLFG